MRLLALAALLAACSEVPTKMNYVADPGACLPGVVDGSPVLITIVAENVKNGSELARAVIRVETDGEKMRVAR